MNAMKRISRRFIRVPGAGDEAQPPPPGESTRDADAALIADVVAGKPERAASFCRRVWPQVDRTVRRLLGRDDSEHEDLAQMAIIELIRSIGGYRGESSLDTWVSAVTAHVVYRYIRRRSLDRHVPIESVHEEALHSWRPNGEDALSQRQTLARIVRHLDRLGEKLAWSFILHDVLGYGLRDVARIMGTSEAAAQSRLVRGRRRLNERIAADPALADLRETAEPERET
jgi:RNA polymerase sigma-70 factor (ECF subfamily)